MAEKSGSPERPVVSLRFPSRVLDEAARRYTPAAPGERDRGRSQALRGAVDRYYEMCRRHFARLGLSRQELSMICEILNGGLLSRDVGDDDTRGASLTVVWAEIADTVQIHPGYGEQWGVSDVTAMALVTKLQTAPYADLVALVDFVERFWADDPEAHKVIYPEPEPAS